jgi:ABC-type sugar transport system substrate-binding protein
MGVGRDAPADNHVHRNKLRGHASVNGTRRARRAGARALAVLTSASLLLGSGVATTHAQNEDKLAALVAQASSLSGLDALKFFETLGDQGLTQPELIQFWIDLPLSDANKQIHDMYLERGLDNYAASYPKAEMYEGFQWKSGMGKEITGPFSGLQMKLPFSDDYVPLAEGPIGDPNRTYTIGIVSGGMVDPWIGSYQDSMGYEANRHSNVVLDIRDYHFDMADFATEFDSLTAKQVDAILTWPMVEASSGPPIQRAREAGIPVLTADRVTSYQDVTSRVTGNFPANGAQNGMYLVWKLAQETGGTAVKGDVYVIGKPAGSTADTIRVGYFLKVLSYFPDINILDYVNSEDTREAASTIATNAVATFPNIDAIFNSDATKASVSVLALESADRMNSREGGKKVIILSIDDSKEIFAKVADGTVETNTPYTPLIGDIQMRLALKALAGESVPQDVATPNIPLVTQDGGVIWGLQSQTVDQWSQYAFGP